MSKRLAGRCKFLRSSSVSRENSGICFSGWYLWTRSQFLAWFRRGKFISYYFWQDYLSRWGVDICGEGGRASYSREKYSASVDNTLLDLINSSYPTQPHSLSNDPGKKGSNFFCCGAIRFPHIEIFSFLRRECINLQKGCLRKKMYLKFTFKGCIFVLKHFDQS